MDIFELQKTNAERAKRWHNNGKSDWNLLEWCGALCGEAGEAANIAKKIRRLDMSLPNKEKGVDKINDELLKAELAKEIADVIIYGLIIMDKLNVNGAVIIADIFNQKSIEYGFPERAPK